MTASPVRLILLVVIWAASWPAIKVGVTTIPPLWYAFLRYLIAALCLFGVVAARGQTIFPPRADWPVVAVISVFQLAAYSALTGIALTVLPPGRASVLAYSTPLWVAPLAAWRLNERISRSSLIGVGLGIGGVFAVATPSLTLVDHDRMYAYGVLMGAAFSWAISIVFIRSHRFHASTLALAPWQMLIAAALLLPLAISFEDAPSRVALNSALSLAYVAPIATAFAYWSVVDMGRQFAASTISMALLAVPAVGVSISAIFLGERVDPSLIAGVVLIGVAIRVTTMRPVASHARRSSGRSPAPYS